MKVVWKWTLIYILKNLALKLYYEEIVHQIKTSLLCIKGDFATVVLRPFFIKAIYNMYNMKVFDQRQLLSLT